MQRELIVKGRGLGGTSDLTLLAPIKPGFVDALEATTYKTRTKLVLDLLHSSRQNLHEYSWAELISDSVERVGAIHSVRVAVLEPEDKVLLAVTFDGSRESYIRVLWDKVGTLLDLVFCGTIDYVTAWNHSFDEWMAWGRRVQIETGFFYGPAEFTAQDVLYERRISKMRERAAPKVLLQAELDELRAVLPAAEQIADNLMFPSINPPADEPPVLEMPLSRMPYELTRMGVQGLAALYSLIGLHRPGTPDGDVLWRAAVDLLREFVNLRNSGKIDQELDELKRSRFSRQLDWLFPVPPGVNVRNVRLRPDPPGKRPDPVPNADVQGGILRGYEGVTHGVLIFLAFPDAAAARDALGWLLPRMTKDTDSHVATPGHVFYNASATFAGVRAAGIDEDTLQLFPEEFRQGMSARAGLIGDIANNHPSRWRQPKRFVSLDAEASPEAVELDAVHLVVQLRCGDVGAADAYKLTDARHPLRAAVAQLIAAVRPHAVLAIQDMVSRYGSAWGARYSIDAFGYAEGIGQPDINHRVPRFERNRVLVGEVVLGYDNASDFAIDAADPSLPPCVPTPAVLPTRVE